MKFNVEFEININDIVNRVKDLMCDILYDDYALDLTNTNYDTLCDEVYLAVAKEIIRTNPEYRKLLKNNEDEKDKKITAINLFDGSVALSNGSITVRM